VADAVGHVGAREGASEKALAVELLAIRDLAFAYRDDLGARLDRGDRRQRLRHLLVLAAEALQESVVFVEESRLSSQIPESRAPAARGEDPRQLAERRRELEPMEGLARDREARATVGEAGRARIAAA